jgi:hypothetical protein
MSGNELTVDILRRLQLVLTETRRKSAVLSLIHGERRAFARIRRGSLKIEHLDSAHDDAGLPRSRPLRPSSWPPAKPQSELGHLLLLGTFFSQRVVRGSCRRM